MTKDNDNEKRIAAQEFGRQLEIRLPHIGRIPESIRAFSDKMQTFGQTIGTFGQTIGIELTWPLRKYSYYRRQQLLKCPHMDYSGGDEGRYRGCRYINHIATGFYKRYNKKIYKMPELEDFKQEAIAGMILYKDDWSLEEFKPEEIIFKAVRKHIAKLYKECQTKQRITDNSRRHLDYISEYTEGHAAQGGEYWQGIYKYEAGRLEEEKERADFDLITQNFEFYRSYEGYKVAIDEYDRPEKEEGFKNWRIGGITLINGNPFYEYNGPDYWQKYDKGTIYFYDVIRTNPQPWQKYEKEPGGGRLAEYIRQGVNRGDYCKTCNMALNDNGECMSSCTAGRGYLCKAPVSKMPHQLNMHCPECTRKAQGVINFTMNDLPFIEYKNLIEPDYTALKGKREYYTESGEAYIYSDPYTVTAKKFLPAVNEKPVRDLSGLSPAVKKNMIRKWLQKPARIMEPVKAKPAKFNGGEPLPVGTNNTGHSSKPAAQCIYKEAGRGKKKTDKIIIDMDSAGSWQVYTRAGQGYEPGRVFIELEEGFILEEATRVINELPDLQRQVLTLKYLEVNYRKKYVSYASRIGIKDQGGRYYIKPLYIYTNSGYSNKEIARQLKKKDQVVSQALAEGEQALINHFNKLGIRQYSGSDIYKLFRYKDEKGRQLKYNSKIYYLNQVAAILEEAKRERFSF